MRRALRALVLAVLLASTAPAHAVDPIVLFLLKMLRDQIITSVADAAVQEMLKPPPEPEFGYRPLYVAPRFAGATEPERIRNLIDESFTDLSAAERRQVYDGLMQVLDDPANAGQRDALLAEFTQTATTVRLAREALGKLSDADRQRILDGARAEFRRLAPAQQEEMLALLKG
ncbi:MAG TPA: hypothetical protein VLW45_03020, partial [Pelomicrobium sp.]|nr:hypothetical protein [Pelomicrobium sp.]